jgi:hypothetical protein
MDAAVATTDTVSTVVTMTRREWLSFLLLRCSKSQQSYYVIGLHNKQFRDVSYSLLISIALHAIVMIQG